MPVLVSLPDIASAVAPDEGPLLAAVRELRAVEPIASRAEIRSVTEAEVIDFFKRRSGDEALLKGLEAVVKAETTKRRKRG